MCGCRDHDGCWDRIEIDLRAEVGRDHRRVTVGVEPERLGTTGLTTREMILTEAGELAAQARVVTVRWDMARRISRCVSEAKRARLTG